MFGLFGSNKFVIEWIESAGKLDLSVWQELFDGHEEGHWWFDALEKSELHEQFKFLYGLVKRNGKVVAVAPAFLMDVPIELVMPDSILGVIELVAPLLPNLRFQRTFFLGSPCADEGAVGVRAGVDLGDFIELLQDAAEKKAKNLGACMIVWKDFPDAYKKSFEKLTERKNLFSMPSFPGTVLALTDDKMESYWQNLKGSRRHNLKKKLKKSRDAADLEVSVIQKPDEALLKEIFGLFMQTYEKGKTKFERLSIKFFRNIAVVPVSWFILLREKESNQLVAFMLCFKLEGRVINKYIGLDYTKPVSWSLYFRLWEASLEWVLAQNVKEYQSGQTGYRFKIDVGNSLVSLTNYCKHTNPVINALFGRFAQEVSWATLDEDLKVYLTAHPADQSGVVANPALPVLAGKNSG